MKVGKMKYNIGWGLTNTCNMNCEFCYSKEVRHATEEVGINDWKKFIDENHDLIESINYGTGENDILDDFFVFIDYVRTNYPSIKQSITTNGYLYERVKNNSHFYDIYKRCIDEVDVSLDFVDSSRHNKFRGQPKAYNWAINTLKMLKEDNKKATIVFVGFDETMTKNNIDGLFKIAKDNNAIVRINIYRPVSKNDTINNRFILKYSILRDMLEYICNNYQILSLNDTLFGNIYCDNVNILENTGIDSIRILPNGDICPSTYLITEQFRNKYSIKDENVLQKIKFDEFIEAPIPEECSDCEIRDKCRGGVFDRRMLWNETLDSRDPYCPFLNNDNLNKEKFKVLKRERISVHDGYLPTMFFKNR